MIQPAGGTIRLRRVISRFKIILLAGLVIFSITITSADESVQLVYRPVPGPVLRDLPQTIDPNNHYFFYLHGRIVEEKGLRPESPRFGIYEYEAILDSLAARGFDVISEPRERGTKPPEYAYKIVTQIQTLLAKGVSPETISVVGFSKGGDIAIATSTLLQNGRVNFVLLAACGDWIFRSDESPNLSGRVLSIRELSDNIVGSCHKAFDRSAGTLESREIELDLGGGHGVFFRPMQEWLDPTVEWLVNQE